MHAEISNKDGTSRWEENVSLMESYHATLYYFNTPTSTRIHTQKVHTSRRSRITKRRENTPISQKRSPLLIDLDLLIIDDIDGVGYL